MTWPAFNIEIDPRQYGVRVIGCSVLFQPLYFYQCHEDIRSLLEAPLEQGLEQFQYHPTATSTERLRRAATPYSGKSNVHNSGRGT